MPTDIRNFFGKAVSKKKQAAEKASNNKSASSTQKRKSSKASSVAPVGDNDDRAKQKKAKRLTIEDSSSSDDNDDKATKKKEAPVVVVSSNKNKRKPDKVKEEDRVEISAQDYFAKSRSSKSNSQQQKTRADTGESPSKRPRRASKDNHYDDDDNDDVESPPSKAKASAKKPSQEQTINLADSDDDEAFQPPSAGDDDDDDILEVVETPSKQKRAKDPPGAVASASKPKPTKRASSATKPKKSATPAKEKRRPPLKATHSNEYFDVDRATPECLKDYTFVLTGLLEDGQSRDDATDWIKVLGGRVTGAVSSKTDYLIVLGPKLEDGRNSDQGSKYKKASTLDSCQIVQGKAAFLGLIQQYSELLGDETADKNQSQPAPAAKAVETQKAAPKPATAPIANPYASKSKITNPYAASKPKVANPYAKPSNPYAAKSTSAAPSPRKPVERKEGDLWVDRYKPSTTDDILGNSESVRKLKTWLARWEEKFNHDAVVGKAFSNPNGPWKAALLSGPPGIGKTTTATLVAQEAGREVVEFNASDVRSKKAMKETLGDITGSRSIQFKSEKKHEKNVKRCIVMDEVDGMGAGDRSGVSELIQMIKHSRVPIICICNDRQAQKLKSLVPYCMDLRYRRPTKQMIAKRAVQVGAQEGMHVEQNAAEAIAESCGNDVRQVLNALQMWASTDGGQSSMTYRDLKERQKSINKDEILRVSLFDAARMIMEGRKGLGLAPEASAALTSFFQRNDAFFVDYNFTGLLVQQNYLKVMQGQFNDAKRSNDSDRIDEALGRMYKAAESMSDYAHVENSLRTDQNWGVLPFVGAMAVKTGYHVGGERGGLLPGFPEFTTWLGRNSTKGKRARLLSEMGHHMNYKISGGTTEMRLSYLPTFRSRFVSLLGSREQPEGTEAAIALMDEYGLDRDDVLEKMDEFKMDPKDKGIAALLDSKKKAAFTRAYNAGKHTSQALVSEQGKAPTKKKKAAADPETIDPDAIDDDDVQEESEDEEDDPEADAEKMASLFKKKGRKPAATGGKKKAAAPKKKKAPSKAVSRKKK